MMVFASLPNRVGSHPVLMVTPFVTPIKKALPHAEERLFKQAFN
jgi:hypothetical protein